MQIDHVALDALLARLEQGAMVLTVNKRLARYLRQAYDRQQQNKGCSAWISPAVYACGGWQRLMAERLGLDGKTLEPLQALRLWERAIEDDLSAMGAGLLRVPEAAREAARAHQLLSEYGVVFDSEQAGEDHRTFLRWRRRWRELCKAGGWNDPALLAGQVLDALKGGQLLLPSEVWLAGFDDLPPVIEGLCQIMQERGTTVRRWLPPACQDQVGGRVAYADVEEEVRCCARWVRHLLESEAERIGVVVLDMTAYQSRLQRIFREELSPGALLPGADAEKAFNLSLGTPLLNEGMVTTAFELLSLGRTVSLDSLSYLLRSPFVWGHLSEQHARAVLDRELRNLRMGQLPLKQAMVHARRGFKKKLGCCDLFSRQLEMIDSLLKDAQPRLPGAWARYFATLLETCQWSKDRPFNSREYQVFTAWKELLAGMACLDAVSAPMKRGEALRLLRRLAADAVFQPEGSEGRVQVLGALEAAGMQFDALWVLGAHEDVFPAPARPHPFIPVALQRRLEMPHADAARELDFAHKVAQRLLNAAPQLVVSWPEGLDGRERQPSPLIHHLPPIMPVLAESRQPAALIQAVAGRLEQIADSCGPPIEAGSRISGGTGILKDQALCPFRAFARHRLGARALATASLGFDGLDRGSLVHRVLEWFWKDIGNWQSLTALDPAALQQLLVKYIDQALEELEAERRVPFSKSQKSLESSRLLALLGEWLAIEAKRPTFTVDTLEAWHREKFGPLTLQTRIDRIDRLADGSQVIIDYKTGLASVRDWLGARPVEPQLPLYTLGRTGADLSAVAFAKVRRGDSGFIGIGRDDDLIPGIAGTDGHRHLEAETDIATWEDLLLFWRRTLQQLGRDFCDGQAIVDPINSQKACDRCDLQPLCRISERDDFAEDEVLP